MKGYLSLPHQQKGLFIGYKDACVPPANEEVEKSSNIEEGGSDEEAPKGEPVHICSVSSKRGEQVHICPVREQQSQIYITTTSTAVVHFVQQALDTAFSDGVKVVVSEIECAEPHYKQQPAAGGKHHQRDR